jgi:predicted 3-demethylubiquinone-9 3-methyltransferase (glyoxalase superfamily)
MQGITPHLWFDTEAVEAARFYCETFPGSRVTSVVTLPDTPSGDVDTVDFELFGHPFMAISAGPLFRFNPSVSFMVTGETVDEVDRYWERLSAGGSVLMELGSYPFSERYGWTTDRYGLSWQISLAADGQVGQRITPTLMFVGDVCGRAEEAIGLYTSVFPDSGVEMVVPYGPDAAPNAEGDVMYASFQLAGQRFAAMDSRLDHDFGFNEAISFLVNCDDQEELDRYADALSAIADAEQCGWVEDRSGLSWQISPTDLGQMLSNGSDEQIARVTTAFLAMKRFDLTELRRVYEDVAAPGRRRPLARTVRQREQLRTGSPDRHLRSGTAGGSGAEGGGGSSDPPVGRSAPNHTPAMTRAAPVAVWAVTGSPRMIASSSIVATGNSTNM